MDTTHWFDAMSTQGSSWRCAKCYALICQINMAMKRLSLQLQQILPIPPTVELQEHNKNYIIFLVYLFNLMQKSIDDAISQLPAKYLCVCVYVCEGG